MDHNYVLLTEKEEMWAQMLLQVLEDHEVRCVSLPVYGAGLALKAGMQEKLRILVPAAQLSQATELMGELFSAEPLFEEE